MDDSEFLDTLKLIKALRDIASLHPDTDGAEVYAHDQETECFRQAQNIARQALLAMGLNPYL